MKSYRKELWFNVPERLAFINITPQVETCLRESSVREGLCLVNAMHITSSVFMIPTPSFRKFRSGCRGYKAHGA